MLQEDEKDDDQNQDERQLTFWAPTGHGKSNIIAALIALATPQALNPLLDRDDAQSLPEDRP